MECLMKWMKYENPAELFEKNKIQIKYCVIVLYVHVACGTVMGWSSPILAQKLNPSDPQENFTFTHASTLVSCVFLCMLLTAVPTYFMVDVVGRKICMIFGAILIAVHWLLIALNVDLIIARLIAGSGVGILCSTTCLYVGEVAEEEIRSCLSVVGKIFFFLGILFEYVTAPFLASHILCGLSSAFPLTFILILLVSGVPETPFFYLRKKRFMKAKDLLMVLKKQNDEKNVEDEYNILFNYTSTNKCGLSLKEIFTNRYNRNLFFALSGVIMFQQLSGVWIVISYATYIVWDTKYALHNVWVMFIGLLGVITVFVSSRCRYTRSKRSYVVASSTGCLVALTLQASYWYVRGTGYEASALMWIPPFTLMLYMITYGMGLGPLPPMILADAVDRRIIDVAALLLVLISRFFSAVATAVFPLIVDNYGLFVAFAALAGVNLLGTIFAFVFLRKITGDPK